jgi:hypothetical protein
MPEQRRFPVGNKGETVLIWVDNKGQPKRKSPAWMNMIANAAARAPEDRSPAERAALRYEMEQTTRKPAP